MKTITEQFEAGQQRVFRMAGKRLEILECSAAGPVSVSLQDLNGAELTLGRADDIDAGTYFAPEDEKGDLRGFSSFAITSSVAQEIKIGISNGDSGTRRVAGTVSIDGVPHVVIDSMPAVLASIPNRQKKPFYMQYGATYGSTAALAAGAHQLIAPAVNVAGMILHRANVYSRSNVLVKPFLLAKASAPASATDGDCIASASAGATAGSDWSCYVNVGDDIYIAPGKGLYLYLSGAETYGDRSLAYTLL